MDMPDEWKRQPIRYDPSIGEVDLVVSLDQQMFQAFQPLIQEFARRHNLKIVVNKGTCGISSGMLARKAIDIGGFCCPPGITDRLPGLHFHTLGIAALVLIVHPDNPVDNLTIEQARQIFMGEIYRWSEIEIGDGRRGLNMPIQPIGRLHCKQRPGHWRLLLDNEDLFSPLIIEVGAIPDMILQVSNNIRAIGYETLWMVRLLRNRGKVKVLKINGYDPSDPVNLSSGKYPLYRVYNLTTWEGEGMTNPLAQKLVNYLLKQVEYLDSKFGLIPASRLREAGWKFRGNELIGEPKI
jgi:DNA-binding transcriptional LysR family regulator